MKTCKKMATILQVYLVILSCVVSCSAQVSNNGMTFFDVFQSFLMCPAGLPQVACLVNPCQVETCVDHKQARCRDDSCTSCENHFIDPFSRQRLPSFQCDCPVVDRVQCYINPCQNYQCKSGDPLVRAFARCESYPCRECNRKWFIDRRQGSADVTVLCEPATFSHIPIFG
ncbi:uncharacterized protein [Watersipora subatra]|uniref:uncharacterized protein n=1 Tax=Watersipora subatra TaxID=2589382 RepID=UPI00355C202C